MLKEEPGPVRNICFYFRFKITHAQKTVNIVTLYFARASSKYMILDFLLNWCFLYIYKIIYSAVYLWLHSSNYIKSISSDPWLPSLGRCQIHICQKQNYVKNLHLHIPVFKGLYFVPGYWRGGVSKQKI